MSRGLKLRVPEVIQNVASEVATQKPGIAGTAALLYKLYCSFILYHTDKC